MKVVILAGGLGTRLSEETELKPKPMVEIGERPILWHIMKIYSNYGFNDFVICLGYKGYIIKEYFVNYLLHQSDVTIDVSNSNIEMLNSHNENWKVSLIDTGKNTMTGGRIKAIQKYINGPFMLTYGDGVSDVNINKLLQFHKDHGKLCTVTSAQPEGRFGALDIDNSNMVKEFIEKPHGDGNWVNAGFFICEPEVFSYINDAPSTVFEHDPLENLALDSQLYTYKHDGFWKCMDTMRDKRELEDLWNNDPPWKIWK